MSEAHDTSLSMEQLGVELINIRHQMRSAFEQGRWQDLADLDKECRSYIELIVATKDQDLFLLLQDTLRFYRKLLAEFSVEKAGLSAEVLQLRRAQSSNRVYRQMSVVR